MPGQSKTITAMLLLSLIISALSGCGETTGVDSTPKDRTLTYAIENDIISLDPNKVIEVYSFQVISEIYEGLLELDANNEIVPVLAESWTHTPNFKIWRFKIRKGVKFHNDSCFGPAGTREVTAKDAVYTFQRTLDKNATSAFVLADVVAGAADYRSGKAKSVSGLRAIDDRTFEVELSRSEPFFLHRIVCDWFGIIPAEAVSLGSDVFGRTKAVGTGPFRLLSRSDAEVILEKNPDYWRQVEGNIDRVSFRVIKNEQIRLSEILNGHVSMTRVPMSAISGVVDDTTQSEPKLKAPFSSSCRLKEFATYNSHFLGFNCDKLNVHLRRAISYGINRNELVSAITHGSGIMNPGPVPAGMLGYKPPYVHDIYDPVKAKEELRQSGHDAAKSLTILVHDQYNSEQAGQLIQQQLSKIGLKIELKKVAFNAAVDQIIKGDAEAFIIWFEFVSAAPEPIITDFFLSSKIPVPNLWRYRNAAMDKRLDTLFAVADINKSNEMAASIEKQVIDDAPAAFLFQMRNPVLYRKDVQNVAINGINVPVLWNITMTGK